MQQTKTTVLKPLETAIAALIENKLGEITSDISQNLILDLRIFKEFKKNDLKQFVPLTIAFHKAKKSLVLVIQNIDFDSIPIQLVVVPTLQEAHDIIEFDEIERDLGF